MSNYFGLMPNLYLYGNASVGIPGTPNNKAAYRWSQTSGTTDTTSTVAFGTTTTVRNILVKPFVGGTTTPNQTASPKGVAAQGFGWNPASSFTDVYVVLERVRDSYMGVIAKAKKPTVVTSPWSGFGNAFQFTADGPADGFAADEYCHVNFGNTFTFGANNSTFTLDVRYKRERVNSPEVIAGWGALDGSSTTGQIFLQHNSVNNKIELIWLNNSNVQQTLASTTAPALNDLVVVRATYDGTTMRLYVNGTLENSAVQTVNTPGPGTGNQICEFVVGKHNYPNYGSNQGNPCKMTLDSVRVSNTARTTGASYTVETSPFSLDANTIFLCDFDAAIVTERRILKAGAVCFIQTFIQASIADALSTTYGVTCNMYKRTSGGTYTFLAGGSSGLIAAPLGVTQLNFNLDATGADVIFENGDSLDFEYWISGRGGGSTGLLSQTVTFVTGYPGSQSPDYGPARITRSGSTTNFTTLADKALTGGVTPTGADVNTFAKYFAGTISTITGVLKRIPVKYFTGSVTSSGIIVFLAKKLFTSGLSPSGTLAKIANKFFAGTLTPAGAILKTVNKFFAGGSTPTGTLTKVANKPFTGVVSSIVGTIFKIPKKPFTGSLTPTPGTLVRTASKSVSGTIVPAGAQIGWIVYKKVSGGLTPTGSIVKKAFVFYSGSISSSATNRLVPVKYFVGTVVPGPSSVIRAVVKRFTAGITPSGDIMRLVNKSLAASITPTGTTKYTLAKFFRGYLYGPSGDGSGGSSVVKKFLINIFED